MCIYGNHSFDKLLFCLGKETAVLKSRGVVICWLRSPVFSDSQSAILAVQPYSRFFFFFNPLFLNKQNKTKQLYLRKADWKVSPFDRVHVLKSRKLCSLASLMMLHQPIFALARRCSFSLH